MSPRSSNRPTAGPGARALSILLAVSLAMAPATLVVRSAAAEPSAADLDTARKLYKDGLELRKAGDEMNALQKFKGAYALTQSPVMGVEVARSEVALGRLIDAREHSIEVDALPVSAKETKASADARLEARKLAGELKTRIPSLRISLVDVPAGARPTVAIDGAAVPFEVLGEPRSVDPGRHVVTATIGNNPPSTADVQVGEGETRDVPLSLAGKGTPTPVAVPTGAPAAQTAQTGATTAPTTSTTATTTTTALPAGDDGPQAHRSYTLVWIGAALVGVGTATGSIAGALAIGRAKTVKDECPNSTCPKGVAANDLDYVKTTATISTIGFAAAGAGVVLVILGLTTGSKSEPQAAPQAAHVTPWVGAGALGLEGSF